MNYIRFLPDGSVQVDPIVMAPGMREGLEQRLMLFYTGVTRKAGDILTEQKKNMTADARLRRHLTRMRDQADELRVELGRGNIAAVGATLHEGWLLKKQLAAGISAPGLDDIYGRATKAGAAGGKILGAGGGGFFLFYVEPERQEAVKAALADLRQVDFRLERQGTRIIYVGD
jgi:D-glycero-alpha-D-manno-heptose-7-phosphate kinase